MPSSGAVLVFSWFIGIATLLVNSVYSNSPVVSGSSPSDYPLGYGYPYGYGNQPQIGAASQLSPYSQMGSYIPQYGSGHNNYYPTSYSQYQQQQHQLRQTLPSNSAYYGSGGTSAYYSRPYGGYGPYSSGYGNSAYAGGSSYGTPGGIRSDCLNQYGQLVPSPLVGGGMSSGSGQFGAGRPASPFMPSGQSVYPQGQSSAGGTFADPSYYKYNPYGNFYRGIMPQTMGH
ncbi:hypothetical protein niasHT_034245 [Heterodera trifolii]|uniref:Uncharacterized protein n=1 Tax=Heterodera trifolii TaxID=157864 RepID=A0ABD2IKL2_9BILA